MFGYKSLIDKYTPNSFSESKVLALISAALAALSVALFLPIMPLISEEAGLSKSMVQYSVGAFILGQAIIPIILGFLADIYPACRIMIFTMISFCVSCLLTIFLFSWWDLVILRMLQGGFSQSGVTISRAMIREESSFNKTVQTFSIIATLQSSIHLLGPFLCGFALGYFSWTFVFYILLFVGMLGSICALLNLKKTSSTYIFKSESELNLKPLFSSSFIFLSLIVSTLHLSSTFFFTFSPFYYMEFKNLSADIFGIYFGITSLGFLLGSTFAARFLYKMDHKKIVRTGIVLCFFSGVSLFFVEVIAGLEIEILTISQFIYSFIKASISPTLQTQALSISKNNRAASSAFFNFISTITAPLGAIFAGWVCIENSVFSLGCLVCFISILDFFLYVCVFQKNRTQILSKEVT